MLSSSVRFRFGGLAIFLKLNRSLSGDLKDIVGIFPSFFINFIY